MRIFIDADAFPNIIKDILMRASVRLNVPLVFVANKPIRVEDAAHISVILVAAGATWLMTVSRSLPHLAT